MAKFLVKSNNGVMAEASVDKVLAIFDTLESEFGTELGIETTEKGAKVIKSPLIVGPEKKKEIKAAVHFALSIFMADRSESGAGREPIADMANLEIEYRLCREVHPNLPLNKLAKWVASTYNKKYVTNPEFEITAQYVANHAKKRGWDQLYPVATVAAE